MTLSRNKKYELAFAALTHKFVRIRENSNIAEFVTKNDLGVDGFAFKPLPIDLEDYKTNWTQNWMCHRMESVLLYDYVLDQVTGTNQGNIIKNNYEKALGTNKLDFKTAYEAKDVIKRENARQAINEAFKEKVYYNPETMLNTFNETVVSMYTGNARANLYKGFTNNLKGLYEANLLDKAFIQEVVTDLFPQETFSLDEKTKTKVAAVETKKETALEA